VLEERFVQQLLEARAVVEPIQEYVHCVLS